MIDDIQLADRSGLSVFTDIQCKTVNPAKGGMEQAETGCLRGLYGKIRDFYVAWVE